MRQIEPNGSNEVTDVHAVFSANLMRRDPRACPSIWAVIDNRARSCSCRFLVAPVGICEESVRIERQLTLIAKPSTMGADYVILGSLVLVFENAR